MAAITIHKVKDGRNAQALWETAPAEIVAFGENLVRNNFKGFRVANASMEPTIRQGSVAIMNPDFSLVDGGIYLLQIPKEGITIKRVYFGCKELILHSDNPLFPEIKLPLAQGDIENILIGKIEAVLFQWVK